MLDATVLIEEFVADFVGWISAGDAGTLTTRLHSSVIEQYGEDLCRSFVEREILELVDYRLDGPVSGPNSVPHGSATVVVFDAPVAFTFQGEQFTGTAGFAFSDGDVYWFATCR
ncbi:MAG: hypothetical protein WEA76_02220 [Acidimicrobiia bacterium]